MKKVSVVLCTYNGSRFLREQLDSVMSQTYPLHEVIIQDDGSQDDTAQIAKEYAAKYDNVFCFSNEAEHGVNGNFYSAMSRATGDYIAICDQDDVWEKNKIALQVDAIGDRMLCAGRTKPFSQDGVFVYYDERLPNTTLLRMLNSAEIAGHTILFRRDILAGLPFSCQAVNIRCYDIVLAVFAAAHDSIIYLDEILVHQRRYDSAVSYTSLEKCTPTARNALDMLWWSIKHFLEVKRKAAPEYKAWEDFLRNIHADNKVTVDGIRMMHLQQSTGILDNMKLAFFCLRHRKEIFHTPGRFPVNALRALLFPVMLSYYKRGLIEN